MGAALALPFADTDAMQRHLDEIALHVARGAHAVLLLDRAGWHTTGNLVWPKNVTPILLPSRSPELNPVEQVWQYLRANYLSNRVFDDLRRHHRRRLRRMEKARRKTPRNHLNRYADPFSAPSIICEGAYGIIALSRASLQTLSGGTQHCLNFPTTAPV